MKKYLALVSALLVASLTIAPLTKVYALGEAEKAVEVTAEDAAKNGLHAERFKKIGRNHVTTHTLRLAHSGKVVVFVVVQSNG